MASSLLHCFTTFIIIITSVGKVIKVAADFIGLLVLGVFNASIAADCIRSDFKCDPVVRIP